ncbi:hypothetical protein [Dongshaea marina]|uniref:hypothetical protein n=1 Tax=Dongshaea marina TaxID=2047966 RepID=UPI000D3E5F8A|nr:hypothetical protein [Dongshaea marina]
MRIEKAYSEDLKCCITSAEADSRYSRGEIESKFNFQCPDTHCSAEITCANLDKPKEKRKRDPYYKVVSKHSDNCLIGLETEKKKIKNKYASDIYSDEDVFYDNAIRINLRPPSERKPESNPDDMEEQHTAQGERRSDCERRGKRGIRRSKTLPSIIDTYNSGSNELIQLPHIGKIHINDLFVEINNQHLSDFVDEFRILLW